MARTDMKSGEYLRLVWWCEMRRGTASVMGSGEMWWWDVRCDEIRWVWRGVVRFDELRWFCWEVVRFDEARGVYGDWRSVLICDQAWFEDKIRWPFLNCDHYFEPWCNNIMRHMFTAWPYSIMTHMFTTWPYNKIRHMFATSLHNSASAPILRT